MDHPAPHPEADIIQMEGVAFASMRHPGVALGRDIHWTVKSGDYWAVAGLQGSGKTDFLMMTGGVMAPLRGRYRLRGEEMPIFDEARLYHRLRLGLVFDGGQLLNHLTIRENISLPLRYHRNLGKAGAEAEVATLLAATELEPWANSTPGAIGRNWQQRAGLARALTLGPEVLLVDNPLSGLDLRHAEWWLGFLRKLSSGCELTGGRPVTLVVTAADLRPWTNHARQFAVLRNQRLNVLGGKQQLEAASRELLRELLPGSGAD
jgi:ABC-type transporter Mla maintaining outer membrane lipid asymmetry ATPase subunit MlaF